VTARPAVRPHYLGGAALCHRPTHPAQPVAILGRLVARIVVIAALLALLPACGTSGLSFVQDERVDIVRPDDRSKVTLPLTVAWTVKDFPVGPGRGSFGVFVDRAPQRVGKSLAWLFRGDSGCRGHAALCGSEAFLAQRNVFRTTRTGFTVEQVNKLSGAQAKRQLHELTVVLLDEHGERVGEGAWSVQFEVEDDR
jgi:hypothetical protein